MKEYFVLVDEKPTGPFSVEQLSELKLTYDSLIWTEGIQSWKKLWEMPDLVGILNIKNVPPLPPTYENEIDSTPTSIQSSFPKGNPKRLSSIFSTYGLLPFTVIWIGFHLFALLMSYSHVPIFNKGVTRSDKFWPFVEFNTIKRYYVKNSIGNLDPLSPPNYSGGNWEQKTEFQGYLVYYDWTEFVFYVGILGLAYIIIIIYRVRRIT
jgi:hypothetical protein